MLHSNPTQVEIILAYLKEGNSITPLEALDQFGCFRLGARCFELRQQGYPIVKRMVPVGNGKKKVAEYRLGQFTQSLSQ